VLATAAKLTPQSGDLRQNVDSFLDRVRAR